MARRRLSTRTALIALVAVVALFAGACSSDDSGDNAGPETTTTSTETTTIGTAADAKVLRIMVTNDDGVAAEGIDVIVQALTAVDDVEVAVVAPAEEKSSSGNRTTEGELTTEEVTTSSGYPAVAVDGYPADTVNWALDGGLDRPPHLVVSGINAVPNLGEAGVVISGTIGAARTAAGRGVPALATSQGAPASDGSLEYEVAAEDVVAWIGANREALLSAEPVVDGDEVEVTNYNTPSCGDTGPHKGPIEMPLATTGLDDPSTNCSRDVEPTNDAEAMVSGWTSFTILVPSAIADTEQG